MGRNIEKRRKKRDKFAFACEELTWELATSKIHYLNKKNINFLGQYILSDTPD